MNSRFYIHMTSLQKVMLRNPLQHVHDHFVFSLHIVHCSPYKVWEVVKSYVDKYEESAFFEPPLKQRKNY